MEFVLELVLDIILDGSMEIASSERMPATLRIIAGFILILGYGVLMVLGLLLTASGIKQNDAALILCGMLITAVVLVFGITLFLKWLRRS